MTTFTRTIGRSGIQVSAMGLGCWAIGGPFWSGETPSGWGEVDDNESIRAIHKGLDLGITFFDTADVYGCGHSERVLARALAGKRPQVVIATKFANVFDESTRQVSGSDASPAYIRRACQASLKRLATDFIDLYQLHDNGYDPALAGEVRDTLEELVKEGKIRAYGWSTDNPEGLKVFAQGAHCAANQHQMNVLEDAPEIVRLCEQHNLASINRGPLAMGLLSGKYTASTQLGVDDVRGTRAPEWMQYFHDGRPAPEWMKKLDAVREILTSGGRTLPQGALGWLWARSPQTLPIPGFRLVRQVEENCAALGFGALSAAQMQEIAKILGR
jgi:aryl-alcohol dehydrogenase-like predicted oxidoreductase